VVSDGLMGYDSPVRDQCGKTLFKKKINNFCKPITIKFYATIKKLKHLSIFICAEFTRFVIQYTYTSP
jgi:hypothetical protein